jgi:predicted DNA-binding protein (MmcQ/YjbR family)
MTLKSTKPKADIARAETALAKLASAYPEVTEEHPWGERAFKVRGKTFLFMGASAEGLAFSVKLPESGAIALALPFTEPTHYGLGKSGWVTARFTQGNDIPLDLVKEWLEESFRAIAPKKIVALAGGSNQRSPKAKPRPRS